MAGIVPETDWGCVLDVYCANLRYAAEQFSQEGIKCLIEPISPGVIPGYFLSRPEDAVTLLDEVNHDNLYILSTTSIMHRWQGVNGLYRNVSPTDCSHPGCRGSRLP